MRTSRSLTAMFMGAVLMLGSSSAYAATFPFTGKFTSKRGKIINIPLVGNTPCAPLMLMTGPGNGGTATPAVHPIPRGANTQPQMAVTSNFKATGRDLKCVKNFVGPGKVHKLIVTDNMVTAMGAGGGFVFPANAFSKPLPPYVRAVEVKYAPPVIQLATSFKITGPAPARTTPPAGTMKNGANTAAFHAFKQGAWMTQTGRAGSMFTWCPTQLTMLGVPAGKGIACTNINQGGNKMIVRYTGGGNAFGGTMAYIITSGPNTSSLGIGLSGGAIGFNLLAGMGSQPTGRGYAEFLTDKLGGGPIWGVFMATTVTPGPTVGPQKLVTSVMFGGAMLPGATNFNFGFPLTTRTVLVRNYNVPTPAMLAVRTTTLTAMGSDMRGVPTAMGNRNLSLVAGGLAVARIAGGDQPTPSIVSMLLPEPGSELQLVAGVAALLGIAAWRFRRSH